MSFRYFCADFETTVYKNQKFTEVWASAICELYSRNVKIQNSIENFFDYVFCLDGNLCIYFHNLKFDGSFILNYLLSKTDYEQAYNIESKCFIKSYKLRNKQFTYRISDMGLFYEITIKNKNRLVVFRDSLKLLPMSVKYIGETFNTKYKKLSIEYGGYRKSNSVISEHEKQYIENDVLVMTEAMETMHDENHKQMTIGACCLTEFRSFFSRNEYDGLFPDLNYCLDNGMNIDKYIRNTYRGGWCYVNPKFSGVIKNGCTLDVNSLYPYVMHSKSGCRYPIGKPIFWYGNFIPKLHPNKYFFIHFKCRFILKKNKLPFIHIRNSCFFNANENLVSSDYLLNGKRVTKIITNNREHENVAELFLTQTDYELFIESYNVFDFEIIDGCYFDTMIGLFDVYLNKYKKIKQNSTGAKRQIAKLFSNNLYGKMAKSSNSSFKICRLEEGVLKYEIVQKNDAKVGYIPIGSAITSYARNYIIRCALKNLENFCYCDTDSLHCIGSDFNGLEFDNSEYGKFKCELSWDYAYFSRQKTYVEIAGDTINICCAGMPFRCKMLFAKSCGYDYIFESGVRKKIEFDNLTDDEIEFLNKKRDVTDLTVGLSVPSKLVAKNIVGGVILTETPYVMHK